MARRGRAVSPTPRKRVRVRDQLVSIVLFAGGFYVVLMGVLGFAGHPRGVAPEIGPSMYWFTYIVGGCALLAGGVLVLRRGKPPKAAWWLAMIAALPAFLLWLYGAIVGVGKMMLAAGPSAGELLAAVGVLFAFALLGTIGWFRVRRRPEERQAAKVGAGKKRPAKDGSPKQTPAGSATDSKADGPADAGADESGH